MGEIEREIAYETTGQLTVCPCCGEPTKGVELYACDSCWMSAPGAVRESAFCRGTDVATGRLIMHAHGVRLRAEGKLPPLKANEQKWGVWCISGKGWCFYADPVTGKHIHETFDTRACACTLRAGMNGTPGDYEVRPYTEAPEPVLTVCDACRAAVCDCNDKKAEWGHWWVGTSPEPCFVSSLSRFGAQVRRQELISAGYPEKRGPVQRRRDPMPEMFRENVARTIKESAVATSDMANAHRYTATVTATIDPAQADKFELFLSDLYVSNLARAIHATDPRVVSFVSARGDSVTIEKAWFCNEGRWRTDAEERAAKVALMMKGGKQ